MWLRCREHVFLVLVQETIEGNKEEAVKLKEQAILKLGSVLAKNGFAEGDVNYWCLHSLLYRSTSGYTLHIEA